MLTKSNEIKDYLCKLWKQEYPAQGIIPAYYEWKRKNVPISHIVCGEHYHGISQEKVGKFVELIKSGVELPPLVCLNGELIDGYHRYHAYKAVDNSDSVDIYVNV